jgi:D-3-phosphoglycerate dehydrogenase / 2-oxoglutarate reductase
VHPRDHRAVTPDAPSSGELERARQIVLFIDHWFESVPLADELAPELECRSEVDDGDRAAVVALVTAGVPVGEAEVAPYPNLKMVLTCSTGTDHLDLHAFRRRGLIVCNTPTYCSEEVADHALACVLAAWRGLWRLDREVRDGAWETGTILRRFDAQRLGVVGLGRIGRALARRALVLGISVVAHDPFIRAEAPGIETPSLPLGIEMLSLERLLATSDAVSLHAPGPPAASAATMRPILGAAEIELMKPGAVLVNLARSSLIDLDAVLAALRRGHLGAVACDVWPEEPPRPGDARLDTPGLLVTPHVAWSSPEAERACMAEATAALRSGLIRREEPNGRVA